MQAAKYSEDGSMIVLRLSEQNGSRGTIQLPENCKLLNMLEDVEADIDRIDYKPFQIITIGVPVDER